MPIVKPDGFGCGCVPDATGREMGPSAGGGLSCIAYDERLGAAAGQDVPWHWHDELEIVLVVEGAVRMRSEGGFALLGAGDVAFFNARSFHMLAGAPFARIRSVVFDPSLVSGRADSVIERRYVAPVVASADMRFHIWRGSGAKIVADEVLRATCAMEHEPPLFELDVRDALSRCLAVLSQVLVQRGDRDEGDASSNVRRARIMRDFIEDNYSESIRVADIASAAGISERECLRCFREMMDETPSRFLTVRRLAHAAHALASNPEMPIASVARSVGIADASRFSQLFRAAYGMSPREYRQRSMHSA